MLSLHVSEHTVVQMLHNTSMLTRHASPKICTTCKHHVCGKAVIPVAWSFADAAQSMQLVLVPLQWMPVVHPCQTQTGRSAAADLCLHPYSTREHLIAVDQSSVMALAVLGCAVHISKDQQQGMPRWPTP